VKIAMPATELSQMIDMMVLRDCKGSRGLPRHAKTTMAQMKNDNNIQINIGLDKSTVAIKIFLAVTE
tara:strand:- start:740 stop:940 length:201 start_codon:yes stop_codon:yes gene_type:complete